MGRCLATLVGCGCLAATAHAAAPLEAVTFAATPGVLYLPLDEAAQALHWLVQRNESGRCIRLHDAAVAPGSLRCLIDGTELESTADLQKAGAQVEGAAESGQVTVKDGRHQFVLSAGAKEVEVSLSKQELRGWQGGRLVMQTHISSGRHNGTPVRVVP